MTDLHTRTRAEVERRLTVARAATPGPWELGDAWLQAGVLADRFGPGRCAYCNLGEDYSVVVGPNIAEPDAAHIVLHDPADAIRRYEHALKVLDRHVAIDSPSCSWCEQGLLAPCDEIRDLAVSLGIDSGAAS